MWRDTLQADGFLDQVCLNIAMLHIRNFTQYRFFGLETIMINLRINIEKVISLKKRIVLMIFDIFRVNNFAYPTHIYENAVKWL